MEVHLNMKEKELPKFAPPCANVPHLIHGGDYNPDQWLDRPDILKEDLRLMKLAGMNSASVAIFAWKALEPREGAFCFEWLDKLMDSLWENGVSVILATPSGSRPDWLDRDHPEALRTAQDRVRILHGGRENHCLTSPWFREKVAAVNAMLARRYKDHPALSMWHISNEYNGECHCPLCQQAFREWLRERYGGSIDRLNHAWWTAFWSHTYTSFDEIESPSERGETSVHGLRLDWMRFVTWQTTSFMKNEIRPLREITPQIPVTTNLMGTYVGLDPWRMAPEMDVVSWDNYPRWHNDEQSTASLASEIAFAHDINRSLKGGKPFLLMESTPSQVNWTRVNKLKKPGMHLLSSIQAVAHGADSVQYFQWRKSRGAFEKFHGAVVDHVGHENTRVFREVAALGEALKKLDGVVGTTVRPQAALIYDWENRWAIDELQGLSDRRRYEETCKEHYEAFWKRGVSMDILSMDGDLSSYRLIVAPMLYMLRPGAAGKLDAFVQSGGTLVLTYLSGYVDEHDLCFLGGFPGDGLGAVAGVWAEEIDALYESDRNRIVFGANSLGLSGEYEAHTYCEIIHALDGCEVLAEYGDDFYQKMPAVTRNRRGRGVCYYIAARTGADLLDDFYGAVIREAGVESALSDGADSFGKGVLPAGVSAVRRSGGGESYLFLLNFTEQLQNVVLPAGASWTDVLTGRTAEGTLSLTPYAFAVLKDRG